MITTWIDPEGPPASAECPEHRGCEREGCPECQADREAEDARWAALDERDRLVASGLLCPECNNDRRDPNDHARPCRWCLGGRVVPGTTRAA